MAPAQWLIQLIALLPWIVRPGVFLAIAGAAFWFVFIHRGLPALWHRVLRGVAIAIHLTVGGILLPEYLWTSSRRRRGEPPSALALAITPVIEQTLDAAAALYHRNVSTRPTGSTSPAGANRTTKRPAAGRRFPWRPILAVVVICTAACVTMEKLSPAARFKHTLADVFEQWREVEAWANVSSADRAPVGAVEPPTVISTTFHGYLVHLAVTCPTTQPCSGTVFIRDTEGTTVRAVGVTVAPESRTVLTIRLPRLPPRSLRHLRVTATY